MNANQAAFPVAIMARVLGVSEAGYYAWRNRPPSSHAVADTALLKRLRTLHAGSRETYGCLVPESRDATLTREGEEALWQAVFTAQPEQRREFEPSSKRRKTRPAAWPSVTA